MFRDRTNFNNDGHMKFDYIEDPNYTTKLLYKYYVDDDIKLNGEKINRHPYEKARPNCRVDGARRYVYGRAWCQRKPGAWHKHDTYGQDIYNFYGIRR